MIKHTGMGGITEEEAEGAIPLKWLNMRREAAMTDRGDAFKVCYFTLKYYIF